MKTSKPLILQISRYFLSVLTLLIMMIPTKLSAQFYQGYQTGFGKNRVQYNDFLWTFYRFKNFDTYFYLGGKDLAEFVGKNADKEIEEVERLFDYKTNGRLQFMIFNRYSDLKQTNIGLEGDEVSGNTGGLTRVMGNKVLIYFDGDHEHLLQQIRAGVAQVLFHQLLYGGNIKDRLQSAVLLTIPNWYEQGLISYVAKGWTAEQDNQMRDGILSGKYNRFNKLQENEGEFAGHSMWHYISQTYGTTSIANLLYMTRINRSIENGFVYVLGVNLKKLTTNWLTYNKNYYQDEQKNRLLPSGEVVVKKPKSGRVYSRLRLSPDGKYAAYVTNDIGKYKVFITDISKGKTRKILKGGYKSIQQKPDLSFPLLAWHPSGQYLTVMREKKGKVWMDYHKPEKRKPERNKFFYFDKVLDFSYSPNGQEIALSGIQNGQSDIFVFNTRSRSSINLTDDFYDDMQPSFSNDSKEIIFASNRVVDTLGVDKGTKLSATNNFDIFILDYASKSNTLKRITNTPLANERYPIAADSGRYYFLSDASGIYNRYVASVDSTISFIDTVEHYRYFVESFPQSNYSQNIEDHHLSQRQNKYAELILSGGRYRMFVNPAPKVNLSSSIVLSNTQMRQLSAKKFMNEKRPVIQPKPVQPVQSDSSATIQKSGTETRPADSTKIDINNYVFQSEFMKPKPKKTEPAKDVQPPTKKDESEPIVPVGKAVSVFNPDSFMLPKLRNYDIAFGTDYFVTQLDNSFQNATYQAFTGDAFYFDPGLNILIKVGVADLMNDYKISGGFRLSGDLNSNEYFLSYDNLKSRIDKTISFYRQGREYVSGFSYLKVHTHEAKGQLRFPFNDLTSLRGSLSFRTDRITTLSTDAASLRVPNVNNYWGSIKLEYVYDNTLSTGLNLWNGLRYKLFAETFRQIDKKETWLGVVGVDVRHYLKLHRQLILATRFAASTSFGDQKLIYYLGSQDNAIIPTDIFDYSIPIDYSQNYGFQAIATNMRGFIQNIRNGNSFALINNEIRFPVFQYLLNKPIRSDFVRNFQIVGFLDVGTAWNGSDPYSSDNSFNTEVIEGNPVTVVLDRQVNPIVAGFGGGLRSRLIGYFIRTDWGWGYEDGVIRDPIFYLSLGLDF
ncbi:MAG: PD40 domain-containing protein [Bacteroidetes bacterium]|nr:PD40 domain-containing protein [Bacteroidota bacterium]